MNDWSRLAVDLNKTQKLGAEKNELHEYKYAPHKKRRGHVLSGSVSLTKPLRREEPRGAGVLESVSRSAVAIAGNDISYCGQLFRRFLVAHFLYTAVALSAHRRPYRKVGRRGAARFLWRARIGRAAICEAQARGPVASQPEGTFGYAKIPSNTIGRATLLQRVCLSRGRSGRGRKLGCYLGRAHWWGRDS